MADEKPKKRPRDILASLDAAFAAKPAKQASKYTAQAAQQTNAAVAQQAYQHKKHKKKQNQQSQRVTGNGGATKPTQATGAQPQAQQTKREVKDMYDPLYGRLDVETLQVGLKNCSLHSRTASLRKASAFHAALKQYVSGATKENNAGAMTDKLKNKVLQFDNPIRTTDVAKRAVNQAQAQSAKLLSARQRRKMGMHLVKADAIEFADAEKLCEIWKRYARDVLGNDFNGDSSDHAARSARLQAKLRTIDLSGCPIAVIKSRNPVFVGIKGIVVADKTQVLQVCTPGKGKVITLPKRDLRFRVTLDEQREFFVDGAWLQDRRVTSE